MEPYFQGFHENEQFSTNSMLSSVDEVVKDELVGMDSIKIEENISWGEENTERQHTVGKEDFQHIMSDWQQHIGPLQSTDSEDLGLDTNLDILNTYSSSDLFSEIESPILSKALKYPEQKCVISVQQLSKSLASNMSRDSFLKNLGSSNAVFDSSEQLYGLIKTEPNVIRKVTLVNGEKEILGKNIIRLHCLNEIKENPDENCQVTSTVINGKRYKIIIKPKSLKVKNLSEEKIRKTLIKKLMQCHLVTKSEPKDEIISEMCNGNYDVPILSSDLLPSWDFAALDFDNNTQISNDTDSTIKETVPESEKKVPPLRVKIPKTKKHKKKFLVKSEDEIDVESISDKVVAGHTLGTLLNNFEEEIAKIEKINCKADSESKTTDNSKNVKQVSNVSSENIKNSLPKEMIDRIEALKRKKECRIPLIQAMPTKKVAKNGTRMLDAVATMNRNKLLKLVSCGDSVQMDHDYCITFTKTTAGNKQPNKNLHVGVNLAEKNPKKDSGMESGDVSDASESPSTPDSTQNIQLLRQVNNKVLEKHRRVGDHSNVTKAATAFFRASNIVTVNGNSKSSDSVKTKTVSYGNKALTNCMENSDYNSVNNSTVPSDSSVKNDTGNQSVGAETQKTTDNSVEQTLASQNERPKKKLKLEEYLNRRQLKEKEKEENNVSLKSVDGSGKVNNDDVIKLVQNSESKEKEIPGKNSQAEASSNVEDTNNKNARENKNRKYWRSQSRRSSSASSGERCKRERRRRSRSKSGCRWRSSSNGSSGRRREMRGKHKYKQSENREGKSRKELWSGSVSQSSSRESSTSSDHSGNRSHRSSLSRYRRRSRSRSVSRGRSRSRNQGFKRSLPGNYYYYNRNFNNRRSKSPFYAYSVREKQRQIEERRVIYIGRIEEGMTNAKLRERFSIFGPIIDISLHFREHGDNYGFVTYAYKADAYDAVEHGNDNPSLPRYDLCFGGRRGFCKEKYADLDGMPTSYSGFNDNPYVQNVKDSFDLLLKEAQAKLKNRKKQ